MPRSVEWAWTLSASSQYCARTDEVAASRSGVLPGVRACGWVRRCHASVVLPETLVHYSGRIIPGQFAGMMGPRHEPWFVEASPYDPSSYGAYPEFKFDHQERGNADGRLFQAPSLSLPQGIDPPRLLGRSELLATLQDQRQNLDRTAS